MSKDNQNQISEDELIKLAMEGQSVVEGKPKNTEQSLPWKLNPITMRQAAKITNMDYDMLYWEREVEKGVSAKRAKSIMRKMRQVSAKTAAIYTIGRKYQWVPFLYAYRWRRIYCMTEDVSAVINTASVTQDKDFFSANSEVIKYRLALSMRGVGESVKEMLKRKESAENMLDKDALPKKEGESK